MPPHVVVIGGNIGAGKTTALSGRKSAYPEPVDKWSGWLKHQYEHPDDPDSLYRFQQLVLAHYTQLTAAIDASDEAIVYVERSPLDALEVFLPLNRTRFTDEAYQVLVYQCRALLAHPVWATATYVYLTVPPAVCADRIAYRNRDGESSIIVRYLEQIDELQLRLFSAWPMRSPVQLMTPEVFVARRDLWAGR